MNTIKTNVTAMSVTPGASTASTKITAELLQCRLCSLKYRVDGRRPMALRCVHTFCEVCLEQLLRDQTDDSQKQRRNKRQQLICPTCETVTPLGRGCTPSLLPVNPSIMELLGIFDRPKVRSNDVAPGFSQVKVGTASLSRPHDSAATNGQLDQELNGTSTMPASMRNKIDAHYGLDLTNHCLYEDDNVEETGSGTANQVNWVSTVNIGGSAPHQQHKRQQQQQQQHHGSSSFSASKVSPAPAAMTSAVTSVSTLKMPPHHSSSTSSYDVGSSRDTNAGSTSTVSSVAKMCSRCGLRPTAVSVASSSQTLIPQKLCSACCNQTASRRNNDEHKPATATGVQQNARMVTKQPDNFVIATSNAVSAANDNPASETFPKRHTNESANARPQTVQGDNTAAVSIDSSGSLHRVKPAAAGFVANRTSTIEVRRRSSYIENRSRAAQSSTQDSDRCLNGTSVDQPVQPTTVQTLSTSTGSKPRQTSATSIQQRAPVQEDTSPDVQPDAVLAPISEEMPTTSGSNTGTGSNTREPSERSSAPSITEIHPLPCNNPPYNPDFEENRNAAWSSTQHHQRASDTPAIGRLDLHPSVLGNPEQHEQKQQSADVSATARSGLALSFMLSNSRHQYPAEQPPKYEDIINENDTVTATAPEVPGNQTQAVRTPTESVAAAVGTPLPMKLVRSFGKYGELSTQPGAFRTPGRVSVSSASATEKNSTRVVVGDSANGTVQVFSDAGECLSMLRADAVRGCCLIDNNSRLLIATDRGVEAYDINGSKKDTIPLGAVLNVVPYGRGFIAVQSKSLSLFKGTSFSTLTRTLTTKAKPGQFNRLLQFDDVCDVAVNSQQDLVVLEAASGGLLTVMTDDGYIKSTIIPVQLDACGRLQAPSAVAVDSAHNIIVSESGRGARVLLFGANGRLQRVLHGPSTRVGTESQSLDTAGPWPAALSVDPDDRLYIIMRGDKFAEIRVYEYL